MLTEMFEKLTSGRRIRAIVYDGGEIHVPDGNEGMVVDYHDGVLNADAWVCYGEGGISLTTNARVNGGMEGFETPLSNIRQVVFMPNR